jgi:hypothetical protein
MTLTLVGSERSVSRPCRIIPGKEYPYPLDRRLAGQRASPDDVAK